MDKTRKMDKSANSSRLTIFTAFLFGGLFYLYYPEIQNYSTTPKWLLTAVLCLVMVLVNRKTKFKWSVGHLIYLLFIVVYLIQCAWSYNPWDSLIKTIPWLLAPLSVLLLIRESGDIKVFLSRVGIVISILILPLLLITLFEVIGQFSSSTYSHLSTYDFRFTFGNRNQYAQTIALLVPLIAVSTLLVSNKKLKYFQLGVIVLIYLTVAVLQNRTAYLVLFGIYPLGCTLYLLQKAKPNIQKFGKIVVLAFVLIGIVFTVTPIRKHIPIVKNLFETNYGSGNERVRIWSNSIDLAKESPLLGHGSGDWKIEILRTPLEFTAAAESSVFYQRAHNDFIQIAVENGAVGLILFILFLGVSILLVLKSTLEPAIKTLLLTGVTGYLLIANLSFPFEKIELLLLLFLFLSPGLSPMKKIPVPIERFIPASAGAVIFLLIAMSYSWLANEKQYFIFKRDKDKYALEEINKSKYTIDPTSTPVYWHEGNSFYGKGEHAKALTLYHKALIHNPYHVHVLNNIGSCHYALKEMEKAEENYKKALSLNPAFVESLMNYASFQFNKGEIDGALVQILSVPAQREPENYKVFLTAIAQAKYRWLMDLYDEPTFENFLLTTYDNADFLYEISKKARQTGASYEDTLRKHLETNGVEKDDITVH